jgi:hypothetical protein
MANTIEFRIDGLDALNDKLTEIANNFPQENQNELMSLGALLEAEIKLVTPVDNGELRRSITHQLIDSNTVEVGTDLKYGEYVNDGYMQQKRFLPAEYMQDCPNDKGVMLQEKFIEGQHFMENGLQSAEPQALQHIENWVEQMFS